MSSPNSTDLPQSERSARGMTVVAATVLTGLLAASAFWRPENPAPLPVPVVAAAPQSRMQDCASCHADIVRSFRAAPHFKTLSPADADAPRFAGKKFRIGTHEYRFDVRDGRLYATSSARGDAIRVDWVFGSGRHAKTPVSIRTNAAGRTEALQHHLSWYPSAGLDRTLGVSADRPQSTAGSELGLHAGNAETIECFGCHSTYVPVVDGRIDPARLVPGIRCARCHAGTQRHIELMSADDAADDIGVERFRELSPIESINRCGECHRRAEQFLPDELRPENRTLPRFAPVGLSQSACFRKQQARRLDCVTCHDPHQPAETQPAHYNARCAECHRGGADHSPTCPGNDRTTNCIGCHMPKVEAQQQLHFTDHWIRIHR